MGTFCFFRPAALKKQNVPISGKKQNVPISRYNLPSFGTPESHT